MRVLGSRPKVPWERLVWSADGCFVAGFGYTRGDVSRVAVWDADAETPATTAENTGVPVAFGPDGRLRLGGDSALDLGTGVVSRDDAVPWYRATAASADGRSVAVLHHNISKPGRPDLRLHRWGGDRWQLAWNKDAGRNYQAVRFSHDGARLSGWRAEPGPAGRADVWIYDAATGTVVDTATTSLQGDLRLFAFGPYPIIVAGAVLTVLRPKRDGGTARVAAEKRVTALAFSPCGRWLATTSNDESVKFWDTATWAVARDYRWDAGRLRSVAFAPDGTRCAAGSDAGKVVVWDVE